MIRTIRCLLIGIGFIVLTAIYCQQAHICVETVVYVTDPNYVQNVYEAQERLRDQGLYDGRIDGIWGPLMDTAYGNWSAIRCFEKE